MSIEAISWAIRQDNLTVAQKMALVVIAEAARDHKGTNIYTSWLAVQTIANRSSICKRTAFNALADLVKLKKLAIGSRKNQTSIYTLLGDIGAYKYRAGGAADAPTRGAADSSGGAAYSTRDADNAPQEVQQMHPNHNKPIKNPTNPLLNQANQEQNLVRPAFTRNQSTETRAERAAAYRQQMRDLGWDPNTMAPIGNAEVN